MIEWWQLLLGGGGLAFVGGLVTVAATRKRDKSTDAQERFAQNIELNKYIDEKILAATAPLKEQIAALDAELSGFRTRDNAIKNILRSFFQRLSWWDTTNRPGPMPMPSVEDMRTLDLDLDFQTNG